MIYYSTEIFFVQPFTTVKFSDESTDTIKFPTVRKLVAVNCFCFWDETATSNPEFSEPDFWAIGFGIENPKPNQLGVTVSGDWIYNNSPFYNFYVGKRNAGSLILNYIPVSEFQIRCLFYQDDITGLSTGDTLEFNIMMIFEE